MILFSDNTNDPRKIPSREEQVCECGKTYFNFMSYMKHRINCETVFIKMMGKLVVNENGGNRSKKEKILPVEY